MGKKIIYRGNQTPGNLSQAQFVRKIAAAVVRACLNTGIFPSVVIGQAIQESAVGNNYKAFVYNNLFGHMANANWSGDSVTAKQSGAAPYWRIYPDLESAVGAHIRNLQQGKYKLKGVALKKTPLAQLQALQDAGYNVGPDRHQYAAIINKKIKDQNLTAYDMQVTAMERSINPNSLAFHEQDGITKALHNIFS